ncbi:hypothetical protein KI387_013203, partial [Taxus chinensis]
MIPIATPLRILLRLAFQSVASAAAHTDTEQRRAQLEQVAIGSLPTFYMEQAAATDLHVQQQVFQALRTSSMTKILACNQTE